MLGFKRYIVGLEDENGNLTREINVLALKEKAVIKHYMKKIKRVPQELKVVTGFKIIYTLEYKPEVKEKKDKNYNHTQEVIIAGSLEEARSKYEVILFDTYLIDNVRNRNKMQLISKKIIKK